MSGIRGMTGEHQNTIQFVDDPKLMNQPVDPDYFWLTLLILVTTAVTNLWTIIILKAKENTPITNLVIWDCANNILISVFGTFPKVLPNDTLCALAYSTISTLATFNRLAPIAIVLLRYIMVCHPIFFINNGRERGVWRPILVTLISLCLIIWVQAMVISTGNIALRFLRCMGREEVFW